MKKSELNVPNILTLIRIILVPATIYLIVIDKMIPALIVFLTACVTDVADGYIARHFKLITKTGIWLDPLADKLMACGVLITFAVRGIVPVFVFIAIICKELIMLGGGAYLLKVKKKSAPSNVFGKAASFCLNASIASGFLYHLWSPYYLYAIYASLAFSIGAMIQYIIKNAHMFFEPEGDNLEEIKEKNERKD